MGYKDPEKQRAYQLQWIKRRREAWLQDKSCIRCGSLDRLELDHIDPKQKLINPAQLWGMSETNPKRIAELAKCQVLCYDCHKNKSVIDDYARLRHGTNTMYTHYRCRCQPCRDAHAQVNALYR